MNLELIKDIGPRRIKPGQRMQGFQPKWRMRQWEQNGYVFRCGEYWFLTALGHQAAYEKDRSHRNRNAV